MSRIIEPDLVQFGSILLKYQLEILRGNEKVVAEPGIEPGTRGFSIRCSTN